MLIIDKNQYSESQLAHWCKLGFIKKQNNDFIITNKDIAMIKKERDSKVYVETKNKLIFYV